MKIKWIGGTRDVPSLGMLSSGDERECSDAMGKDLIRQGLAKEIKEAVKGTTATAKEGGN